VVAVVVVAAPTLSSARTKTDQSGGDAGAIVPVSKIVTVMVENKSV